MAKYTENIRLAQPEGSDYYDIEVFNHNSELIDKKIGEMDNSLSTIKEGATRAKAGIVQLGTEEGKALEGMMLARLAGAYGYGGDIQDEGVKNPNYIYYDRNTRKMYKCLNQNSDVSANVANFIPLDNNSLLDRLENLITFSNNKDWNIIELTNEKVILMLKKRVSYSSNKYTFELPFKIENEIVLASSEDINNQVLFTASKVNNEIQVKRWPDTIAGGSNVVNIYIIANRIIA